MIYFDIWFKSTIVKLLNILWNITCIPLLGGLLGFCIHSHSCDSKRVDENAHLNFLGLTALSRWLTIRLEALFCICHCCPFVYLCSCCNFFAFLLIQYCFYSLEDLWSCLRCITLEGIDWFCGNELDMLDDNGVTKIYWEDHMMIVLLEAW